MSATKVLAVTLLLGVAFSLSGGNAVPNVDVFKLAQASENRVLFSEDFEGPNPREFVQWYGGRVPFSVEERAVVDEEAHSGKHCFKLTIKPPDEYSEGYSKIVTYFWIPVRLPRWSELTITMYVKTDPPDVGYEAGAGGSGGSVLNGAKVETEDSGWEKWQARAVAMMDPGDYVQGLAILCYLPKGQGVTTYFIDDITVEGRLPDNYAELHEQIKQTVDTEREQARKQLYTRRLNDLVARFTELRQRFNLSAVSTQTDSFAAAQRTKVAEHITAEIERLTPLINGQFQAYRESDKVDSNEINPLERALGPLEVYIDNWLTFGKYLDTYGGDPFVVYTLEPTQSYRILPGGPEGHREENSYYQFGGYGGLENPQILPDTSLIPATPSRSLEAFGCRGQYIPLSFVVQTAAAMLDLQFKVSELRDSGKVLSADTVDLRVVKAWWRPYVDHGNSEFLFPTLQGKRTRPPPRSRPNRSRLYCPVCVAAKKNQYSGCLSNPAEYKI